MGEPGHWLNESWQIGAALRDHAEMLQGFQDTTRRGLMSTTAEYLAAADGLLITPTT